MAMVRYGGIARMTEKIRICVIMYNTPHKTGGAEKLILELSQALAKKGHPVSLVCKKGEKKTQTLYFKFYPLFESGIFGFLKNFYRFYRFLKFNKVDVINAHYTFPTGTISLIGKLLHIPLIVTSHGLDIQKNYKTGYGARLNKIYAIVIRFTLKLIEAHVVLSKTMIKDAIEAGSHPSKIKVVYNGIDLDKVSSFGGTDILQRYWITKDNFTVLYLGRLHTKKCPDDLIKAFQKVVKKVSTAKLIFAGKGEEEMKLKRFTTDLNLKDNVIFAGFVSEDEKWDLLKRCDVFVLPSVVEGHPITIIEAMACCKPVIATNVGPFPEIISNGETGLLVPLHSPNELADAIIELALNKDKRIMMGKKARRDIEERFDINKIADDYLEIYEELINK